MVKNNTHDALSFIPSYSVPMVCLNEKSEIAQKWSKRFLDRSKGGLNIGVSLNDEKRFVAQIFSSINFANSCLLRQLSSLSTLKYTHVISLILLCRIIHYHGN